MNGFIDWIKDFVHGGQFNAWIAAVVIIAATAVVSSAITKLIRKIAQVDGAPLPSSSILVNIARSAIWVIGVSIMLSACFGVDVNGLITALGIGGIAISLGLQDTIKNFFGGLQLTLMKIVHPGDHIAVGEIDGIVQDVNWRHTTVHDYDGNTHIIPNAVMNSTAVTKSEPSFIVVTPISFTNDGRDLDAMVQEMEQLAKRAVEEVAPLEKDPWILLTQIGEYGTWGKLRFVLKDVEHAREARDAALRAISPYTRNNATTMLHDSGSED